MYVYIVSVFPSYRKLIAQVNNPPKTNTSKLQKQQLTHEPHIWWEKPEKPQEPAIDRDR